MGFDALPQVLQCIWDLFQGANAIMNGLTAYVRIISKSVPGNRVTVLEAMELVESSRSNKMKGATTCLRKEKMTTVVWTMPLELPSVQLYHKVKQSRSWPACNRCTFRTRIAKAGIRFPPKFIHSLDATHKAWLRLGS